MMLKMLGLITKRRIGFSGTLSSAIGLSVTKPWKMYERFFQYLRAVSSNDGSLNQGRISACTGQVSPHISTQGTVTVTCLCSSCPFTPLNGIRIIWRSFQK